MLIVRTVVFLDSSLGPAVWRVAGLDVEEVPGHQPRAGAPAQLPSSEHRGEYVSKGITTVEEGPEEVEGVPGGPGGRLVVIVFNSLITVTQHLVSLGQFFEFFLRVWRIIFVRVELKSFFLVGLLNLLQGSGGLDTENRIIVFGHCI